MRSFGVSVCSLSLAWATTASAQSEAADVPAPVVSAESQRDGDKQPALEVTVRGRRPGTRGLSVDKLERSTVERMGVNNVSEALHRLPAASSGLSARGERIVSLRGFDQRQILVTIDGAPIQVPYDGQMDLGKFPIGLIEHISVVKGSGSLLYGPNGLGGAIDVATRRPGDGSPLTLVTETEPFNSQRLSGVGTHRFGSVAVLAGAAFENVRAVPMSSSFRGTFNEDGGARENSDRRNLSAIAKVLWELDERNEVRASAWHLDGRYGVPPGVFDLTRRFWRWSDWYVDSYSVGHGYRSASLNVDETLYYSRVGNTLDSYDDSAYRTQNLPVSGTSRYADHTFGGHVRGAYRFGCEADAGCVSARGWLGVKKDGHRSRASHDAPWFGVDTTVWTASGQLDGPLGNKLLWLGGIQVDAEAPGSSPGGERANAAFGLGPMAAMTWQATAVMDVTASVAERTRFPTLKERFSEAFGSLEPNPSLMPERATNLSLDTTFRPLKQVKLDASVFDSEVRSLVIQVPVDGQRMQWQNAGRARFFGVEGAVRARAAEWVEVWGGWAAMQARRLDQAPPEDLVPYRPVHKGTAVVTVFPSSRVEVAIVARYVGEQSFQNEDTGRWGTLGGTTMFDARMDWRPVNGLRVWLRGTNLGDSNVQSRYSFPEQGRQLYLGASFQLSRDSSGAAQGAM